MKVCEYVPHGAVPDIRGFAPAIVAQNFAKFLKEETYIISAAENYAALYENSEYGNVYRIKQSDIYKKLFTKVTKLDPYPMHARAAKIVNKHPVDIFHAHQLEFPVDDFRKKTNNKTKIVIHGHVTRTFDKSWGQADAYIAASEYIKTNLIDRGFDERLIDIVRNGVNTKVFAPITFDEKIKLKETMGIPLSAKVAIFAGRKQEVKGFEVVLTVADRLLSKYEDLYFIAVGAEPNDAVREKSYIGRQKLRTELANNPRFMELGAMKQENLANIFKIADIGIFPSKSEPQGMVMIEAMSCGCNVISSNLGGIKESIDHGVNGWLADDPSSADEVFALVQNAIEKNSAQYISTAARQKILDKFSWERVSTDLLNVYNGLIS